MAFTPAIRRTNRRLLALRRAGELGSIAGVVNHALPEAEDAGAAYLLSRLADAQRKLVGEYAVAMMTLDAAESRLQNAPDPAPLDLRVADAYVRSERALVLRSAGGPVRVPSADGIQVYEPSMRQALNEAALASLEDLDDPDARSARARILHLASADLVEGASLHDLGRALSWNEEALALYEGLADEDDLLAPVSPVDRLNSRLFAARAAGRAARLAREGGAYQGPRHHYENRAATHLSAAAGLVSDIGFAVEGDGAAQHFLRVFAFYAACVGADLARIGEDPFRGHAGRAIRFDAWLPEGGDFPVRRAAGEWTAAYARAVPAAGERVEAYRRAHGLGRLSGAQRSSRPALPRG